MIYRKQSKILFLPGLLNDGRLWQAQIHALSPHAEIEVGDLKSADTIAGLADNLMEVHFKDHSSKINVVALSMGGYVALELMRRLPDKIAKLAIFNSSARADSPEQTLTRKGLIELSERGEFLGVTPRLLPRLLHPKSMENKDITDLIMDMAKNTGKDAFIRQQKAIMSRIDSRDSLKKIKAPTLFVAGKNDLLTPVELMEEMHNLMPQSEFHVIDDSGHLTPLEQPQQAINLLLRFLA